MGYRADDFVRKAIAERAPFVQSGAERYKLRTWQLSCRENHHLGFGD